MSLPLKKKIMFCIVMLGTLCFFPEVYIAEGHTGEQQFISKKYTTDNGLCHDYVHWITQDKTGFLWVATWDGVSRFDGIEFRNYYHQPGQVHTLPFFAIDKVVVDRLNNVWILAQQRPLVRYDRAGDRFVREYFNVSGDTILLDIITGRGNDLWLSTRQSVYRYDPSLNLGAEYKFSKRFSICAAYLIGLNKVLYNYGNDYNYTTADLTKGGFQLGLKISK